jgi:hypothetical protein
MRDEWRNPTDEPADGDSVWFAIREHDGVNYHVDYGVAFRDVDGLIVRRFESDDYELWPPSDMVAWQVCDVPHFEPQKELPL